jgi:hypothetical protein
MAAYSIDFPLATIVVSICSPPVVPDLGLSFTRELTASVLW